MRLKLIQNHFWDFLPNTVNFVPPPKWGSEPVPVSQWIWSVLKTTKVVAFTLAFYFLVVNPTTIITFSLVNLVLKFNSKPSPQTTEPALVVFCFRFIRSHFNILLTENSQFCSLAEMSFILTQCWGLRSKSSGLNLNHTQLYSFLNTLFSLCLHLFWLFSQ